MSYEAGQVYFHKKKKKTIENGNSGKNIILITY